MVASWASSVLAYGSYLTYKYLYDGFFYSETKKNTILFGPPPSQQKRRGDTNGHDMATRTCVCLYQQPVTWIFTRSG